MMKLFLILLRKGRKKGQKEGERKLGVKEERA
jgi:hypothetical protein